MIGTVVATAGQPVTIDGYAQDFGGTVTHVQFSCDEGATWTAYELGKVDPNRNVNWTFTFTPPEAGIYDLLVRAQCDDGRTTPQPARIRIEASSQGGA